MTTVGFHGLTSAPSAPSEYVVAPGPMEASRSPSSPTQAAAHTDLTGEVRRRTTHTHPTAARALMAVAPMNSARAPEPKSRYATDSR